MTRDIVERLRDRAYSGLPDPLLVEAADEIERLRRVTDPMPKEKRAEILSWIVNLTAQEREAIRWICGDVADIDRPTEATLRALLARLG